jgi:hypothetical protein
LAENTGCSELVNSCYAGVGVGVGVETTQLHIAATASMSMSFLQNSNTWLQVKHPFEIFWLEQPGLLHGSRGGQ